MLCFPTHLSSASALPCEMRNTEHSALVHCACNRVYTAAALSSSFLLNHAPKITRLMELYSSVSMSR